ncbi:hypothetical protein ACEWPL_016515 [Roseovarius sp. S1116L3]|uniref:hypothetical protein n=1 Tax=Roseovarius roseus TaxID=3342636 RepID=UPI00372649AB
MCAHDDKVRLKRVADFDQTQGGRSGLDANFNVARICLEAAERRADLVARGKGGLAHLAVGVGDVTRTRRQVDEVDSGQPRPRCRAQLKRAGQNGVILWKITERCENVFVCHEDMSA